MKLVPTIERIAPARRGDSTVWLFYSRRAQRRNLVAQMAEIARHNETLLVLPLPPWSELDLFEGPHPRIGFHPDAVQVSEVLPRLDWFLLPPWQREVAAALQSMSAEEIDARFPFVRHRDHGCSPDILDWDDVGRWARICDRVFTWWKGLRRDPH